MVRIAFPVRFAVNELLIAIAFIVILFELWYFGYVNESVCAIAFSQDNSQAAVCFSQESRQFFSQHANSNFYRSVTVRDLGEDTRRLRYIEQDGFTVEKRAVDYVRKILFHSDMQFWRNSNNLVYLDLQRTNRLDFPQRSFRIVGGNEYNSNLVCADMAGDKRVLIDEVRWTCHGLQYPFCLDLDNFHIKDGDTEIYSRVFGTYYSISKFKRLNKTIVDTAREHERLCIGDGGNVLIEEVVGKQRFVSLYKLVDHNSPIFRIELVEDIPLRIFKISKCGQNILMLFDDALRTYDLEGKLIREISLDRPLVAEAGIASSNHMEKVAVAHESGIDLYEFSLRQFSRSRQIELPASELTTIELSGDGELMGLGDSKGGLYIWNTNNGRLELEELLVGRLNRKPIWNSFLVFVTLICWLIAKYLLLRCPAPDGIGRTGLMS